jgi:hypothetical protein
MSMTYFERQYLRIQNDMIIMAPKPGTIRRRTIPSWRRGEGLVLATATLDDPGAVKRGWTLTTGMLGRNRDKGALFVTVSIGNIAETVEIPREYGSEAREMVARINALGRAS